MSIEIVLIPLAFAAVSAWQAKRAADEHGTQHLEVGTRMRDPNLLAQALRNTNAVVTHEGERLVCRWGQIQAGMARSPDGIWSAHFSDQVDVEHATALLRGVDAAYGQLVQQAVLARLKERATVSGMVVESEKVEEDRTVTLVLNVSRGG